MKQVLIMLLVALGTLSACKAEKKSNTMKVAVADNERVVLIETSLGNVKLKLYNETPKHRDNFIKLVEEHTYDGIIFHRVIKNFMIQTGDPTAKNVPMDLPVGGGDVDYTLPAEIVYPKYFHKYGALAAAREGDDVNPKRESSGAQFYIVTGKKYTRPQLERKEYEMNEEKLKMVFDTLAHAHMKEIYLMRRNKQTDQLIALQDSLEKEAKAIVEKDPAVSLTSDIITAYTTIGGVPHLDNAYTVFGEVIEGMDVVEQISMVRTNRSDRPLEDVVITKVSILQ